MSCSISPDGADSVTSECLLQSRESGASAPSPRLSAADRRRSGRFAAAGASVSLHAALLLMILFTLPKPPLQMREPPAIPVVLMPDMRPPAPTPAPTPKPPAPKVATSTRSSAKASAAAAAPRPATVASPARRSKAATSPLAAADEPDVGQDSEVSEGELAGAASAGGGGGGGPCDMAARIQAALRKDTIVKSAVATFAGKAIKVWNGDWVRSLGEDGKGLAAVREAMMWEVAFAPPACRAEPVRGLVVMSVDSPQGKVRLALGAGQWRWSDLLATSETGVTGSLR
jgi:hypothetical protein